MSGTAGEGPAAGASALARVLREVGGPELYDVLTAGLTGADLTTLLLAVVRTRAARLRPTDVLRRYLEDRFAAPAPVPFARLRRAEDALLAALPDRFEMLTLSPVLPLGSHSAVATVDQNKVVSAVRGLDVAADPTNGLALVAAARRRDLTSAQRRGPDRLRLAALQRVVRAQRFDHPAAVPHFTLLGLVTAGRDTGDREFERRVGQPDLLSGRSYYHHLCFKIMVDGPNGSFELGDGDSWTGAPASRVTGRSAC